MLTEIQDPQFYADIGLMVGLEVHQQLLTAEKMFCRCPAGLYTETHDGTVLRHMRPTLSELGEYDGTALMEFKTRKNIVYLLHKGNVCTYEMDDTPPFLVNQQALDVAIEQCLMLNCDIIDEVHIARKQYLDGSIPTGFQRTAIVGVNGRLPFRGRELSVIQVSMEEDSCREVSDRGHCIVWRTDRLGMPLIETVTAPELKTPDEVEEAILLVGRVCRSTGHVRTGMGTSRQDVNVSVRGGRRVEIKGVPKAGWAPMLVHGEAVRQYHLLQLKAELAKRGFQQANDLQLEELDVTSLFSNSGFNQLTAAGWNRYLKQEHRRSGFELGEGRYAVRAIRLTGMTGLLNYPTQPDHTFAHELKGRIRVIAGLDQQPILLYSDKWPDYEGSYQELRKVRRALNCTDNDELVVVWGPEQDTITAANEIRLRFIDALDGVPNETRQPFADGHTDFERILPGPDRMYPDTDSPPTRVTRARVERLQSTLPENPWSRELRYAAAGVPRHTVHYLIRRGGAQLVDLLVREAGADLHQVCFFVGEELKGLKRAGVAVEKIDQERWIELFLETARRPALWDARRALIREMTQKPGLGVADCATALGLDRVPRYWDDRAEITAREGFIEPKGRRQRDGRAYQRQLHYGLGRAMMDLRGRVSVAEVRAALQAIFSGTGDLDAWRR